MVDGTEVGITKPWYKKWWGIIIAVLFLPLFGIWYIWTKTSWNKGVKFVATIFVLFAMVAVLPTPKPSSNDQTENPPAKTDQQVLEESLTGAASKASGMKYLSIEMDKSDPDRPKGTQMITVSVKVESFFNKNQLVRTTGELSSSIFQAVYGVSSMKAYDVFVWYYGEVTDQYGNKKDEIILVYHIDKVTYGKINWQNFNQSDLCDLLATGNVDTACNILVNIQ